MTAWHTAPSWARIGIAIGAGILTVYVLTALGWALRAFLGALSARRHRPSRFTPRSHVGPVAPVQRAVGVLYDQDEADRGIVAIQDYLARHPSGRGGGSAA